ncbi:MAG TPA: amidohydrolase family protein, partial [Sulfurovum sp.]|uniref:N-acetylglucosamine-6-phosphate deacetylase n=1 Tax=Sulfurovum sp. TaxID=1969726 RepID=UPI002F95BA2F
EDYMQEVKMITLAPEIDGAEAFVKELTSSYPHIILSIGHSAAGYEEAKESFTWGISHATHLFNAMTPYHHREPGIVGAVFDSDVTCDIIADLVHTHPSVLELVQQMKKEKLILITDAMRAGCMKCGTYDLGGRRVEVNEGKAVLEDGTLAGSVLKMHEALLNMKRHTSMELVEIVNSVTKIPARKLGVKKGELREGYDADMVIFDESFSIISTIVNGEVKYRR